MPSSTTPIPSPGNCASSIKCGNAARNSFLGCRIAFADPAASAHAGREITDATPAPARTCKNSRLCMNGMVLRLLLPLRDERNTLMFHFLSSFLVFLCIAKVPYRTRLWCGCCTEVGVKRENRLPDGRHGR